MKRRTYVSKTDINVFNELLDDDYESNVEAFIRYARAADLSKYTIVYYEQHLLKFMRALEEVGCATRLNRITSDMILKYYIEPSLVKGHKYSTVATTLRALRAFFNWSVTRGVIETSPMDGIKIKKPKDGRIETFSRTQIQDILMQPNLDTFVGLRDYTIMVVLLDTGVRLRELVDIEKKDILWQDSQILIHGKNGQDRRVPFQAKCRRVLKSYIQARGKSDVNHLFITQDDGQMSRKAVQDRIAKYGRMAMIDNVRCSPHTFRHTFAKMSVKNGANVFHLQKILGHQSLDMVRIYVNLFSNEVSEAHKKFSPVENLLR